MTRFRVVYANTIKIYDLASSDYEHIAEVSYGEVHSKNLKKVISSLERIGEVEHTYNHYLATPLLPSNISIFGTGKVYNYHLNTISLIFGKKMRCGIIEIPIGGGIPTLMALVVAKTNLSSLIVTPSIINAAAIRKEVSQMTNIPQEKIHLNPDSSSPVLDGVVIISEDMFYKQGYFKFLLSCQFGLLLMEPSDFSKTPIIGFLKYSKTPYRFSFSSAANSICEEEKNDIALEFGNTVARITNEMLLSGGYISQCRLSLFPTGFNIETENLLYLSNQRRVLENHKIRWHLANKMVGTNEYKIYNHGKPQRRVSTIAKNPNRYEVEFMSNLLTEQSREYYETIGSERVLSIAKKTLYSDPRRHSAILRAVRSIAPYSGNDRILLICSTKDEALIMSKSLENYENRGFKIFIMSDLRADEVDSADASFIHSDSSSKIILITTLYYLNTRKISSAFSKIFYTPPIHESAKEFFDYLCEVASVDVDSKSEKHQNKIIIFVDICKSENLIKNEQIVYIKNSPLLTFEKVAKNICYLDEFSDELIANEYCGYEVIDINAFCDSIVRTLYVDDDDFNTDIWKIEHPEHIHIDRNGDYFTVMTKDKVAFSRRKTSVDESIFSIAGELSEDVFDVLFNEFPSPSLQYAKNCFCLGYSQKAICLLKKYIDLHLETVQNADVLVVYRASCRL